ncbi:MAG: NUDIX domain-containing protein [Thermomicrobiales bacterium]
MSTAKFSNGCAQQPSNWNEYSRRKLTINPGKRWRTTGAPSWTVSPDFAPNLSLAELLERVSLATVSDLDRGERERVTMMTIYSAKGHEWPIVFMIGAEDGEYPYFPFARSGRRSAGISPSLLCWHDPRSDRLLLTSARRFEHQPRSPSPFLRDIDDLVRHHFQKHRGRPLMERSVDRPRNTTAVGAVVVGEAGILLVRMTYGPTKGRYMLPGGIVDPGETLDVAVVREVREETASQP